MNHAVRAVLIGFAVAVFSCSAWAQVTQTTKMPEQTKAIYVAMLYEKFKHPGGDEPDFGEWVRKSPDYDAAELYQRPALVSIGIA